MILTNLNIIKYESSKLKKIYIIHHTSTKKCFNKITTRNMFVCAANATRNLLYRGTIHAQRQTRQLYIKSGYMEKLDDPKHKGHPQVWRENLEGVITENKISMTHNPTLKPAVAAKLPPITEVRCLGVDPEGKKPQYAVSYASQITEQGKPNLKENEKLTTYVNIPEIKAQIQDMYYNSTVTNQQLEEEKLRTSYEKAFADLEEKIKNKNENNDI